jgi:hypothetical protein
MRPLATANDECEQEQTPQYARTGGRVLVAPHGPACHLVSRNMVSHLAGVSPEGCDVEWPLAIMIIISVITHRLLIAATESPHTIRPVIATNPNEIPASAPSSTGPTACQRSVFPLEISLSHAPEL